MKKLFLFALLCLMALAMNAQKCAVLEFRGSRSLSAADVDGISEMFMTYFHPSGYTMVERVQIDKVISEQGFQHSSLTDAQAVEVGRILNVSKVVVGKVSMLGGQYQVDVRVVDVQSGHDVALDGATFSGDYRTNVRNLAQRLAGKIAIQTRPTVSPQTSTSSQTSSIAPKTRSTVETLYGYLKIFPKELGTFEAEPISVIRQINNQAQYGYNNWRIPTNEELSLLKANNYLRNVKYMTKESKNGIVLLVTDGENYATIQEGQRREDQIREEQRREEQRAQEAQRIAQQKAEGWIDLGLPSGTLWKNKNESGFYSYNLAVSRFGSSLPTMEQCIELINTCKWVWNGSGYKVVGPSGASIILPASGWEKSSGEVVQVGITGFYWSSTTQGADQAWCLQFAESMKFMHDKYRGSTSSVRLVK